MATHYCRLLEGGARNPEGRLELLLLNEEEFEQLVIGWNQTATGDFREEFLQDIFERRRRASHRRSP
jgi:hypothetical protein